VCGYLGENVDWHVGFAAAGVGMALGLVQYVLGAKYLPPLAPIEESPTTARHRKLAVVGIVLFLAIVAVTALAIQSDWIDLNTITVIFGVAIVLLPIVFFISVLSANDMEPIERKRFISIIVFFVFSIFFWSAFEQAGSSLTIFARDYTDRFLMGIELPASFFQSLNPLYIIILTPVFALFWLNSGKKMISPTKFSLGLAILGMGFMVLAAGSFFISVSTPQISPMWLVVTYLFHTIAELFLSPVGLSLTTKLAPAKYASQSMGVWFLSSAVANFIGGEIAGYIADLVLWQLFGVIALTGLISGSVLFAVRKSIQNLMGGIR
jgi:POT family proton-dependent oligopeptide transporter